MFFNDLTRAQVAQRLGMCPARVWQLRTTAFTRLKEVIQRAQCGKPTPFSLDECEDMGYKIVWRKRRAGLDLLWKDEVICSWGAATFRDNLWWTPTVIHPIVLKAINRHYIHRWVKRQQRV
jgi:hypothetical protein